MLRALCLFLAMLLIGAVAYPAAAQIIVTESSNSGERVLMSEMPHRAEYKIMIRAVARVRDGQTEWVLTFQSTDARDDVQLTVDGERVAPQRVVTDDEAPGGVTTLFLSGEAFYEIAHASEVGLTIGERSFALPAQVRDDMQRILNRSGRGS